MLKLENISNEAKAGKIIILIAVILQAISAVGGLILGSFALMVLWGFFGGFLLILVKIAGLLLGIGAYKSADEKDFRSAGKFAIISSLLPPLDIMMFAGGVLCLISKEAEKKNNSKS